MDNRDSTVIYFTLYIYVNQPVGQCFNHMVVCFSFEKMISGMYMGELVRLILLKLTKDNILFGGKPSEALLTKWRFKTKYVSEIERLVIELSDPLMMLSNKSLTLDSK